MNNPCPKPPFAWWIFPLLVFCYSKASAQDPLNRSVQVSVIAQENPPKFDFKWGWDWSGGDYTVYRKTPNAPTWGQPVATLPWGAISFTDENVEVGVPYEYAFYKKEFEDIIDTVEVQAGAELVFTFQNIYGDGLCCNFGFGWYLVVVCGDTVATGSDFGLLQADTFTVCNNGNLIEKLVITIRPDMQVNNSFWRLTDENGVEVASSGPPGTWLDDRPKYGYILAGMKLPAVENRGTILLVVDDAYTQPLAAELEQLELDLMGDGWKVKRLDVNRNDPVTAVKSMIIDAYSQTPDLKMLYLLGHIPVPYSGSIYPDGHVENHWGAWAADVYYGDMDGVWTDETVTNTSAQFAYNHNVPGDGKFDQSAIPSAVELAVGRVDLYDMPAFGLDDVELTRRYLNKAHLFKTGQLQAERRALVDDNLNIVLASPAASGWRNFAPMFHHENVQPLDYFSTMNNESYLWSYGCGSGTHTSAAGIGTTQDFASDTLKNIFTMLLGSQFGDWDNTNNFLRAPLASPGWTLASCWAGNPPYTFHRMAMGEPIGYGLLHTQNATRKDYYPGPQLVHTALMGDPTLRLHPVKPAENLEAQQTGAAIELNWTAPEGEDLAGYNVYRAASLEDDFVKINAAPITITTYHDLAPIPDTAIYMVRTVKLDTSGSGTYWNLSLGVMKWGYFDPCFAEPYMSEISPAICVGQSFEIGDTAFLEPGEYVLGFVTNYGCDSFVLVNLTVLPAAQSEIDTFFLPPGIDFFGHFYTNDTTVTIELEASNGCDSILTANLYLLNLLEESQAGEIVVFPNPAQQVLTVQAANEELLLSVQLFDVWGRAASLPIHTNGNSLSLDVSHMTPGVYLLKMEKDGQQFYTKIFLMGNR